MDFIYHRDMIMVYKSNEWNHITNQIYMSINNIIYNDIINNYLPKTFKKNDHEYNINNICIKIKQRFILS